MKKLVDWIRQHQIAAFYIITFAISWGLGFSWIAIEERELWLLAPLAFIAACGPALAGIFVSAVSNTEPRQGTRKSYWIAFLIAWALSVLVALAFNRFINQVPISLPLVVLLVVAVLPVAFVISAAYSRIPTVRDYVSSLVRLRGVWGWALVALVLLPTLILISVPLGNTLSGQPVTAHRFPDPSLSLLGLITITFAPTI